MLLVFTGSCVATRTATIDYFVDYSADYIFLINEKKLESIKKKNENSEKCLS